MKESCTILGYTTPPEFDEKAKENKEIMKLWEGCVSFGDAVVICLNSEPEVS